LIEDTIHTMDLVSSTERGQPNEVQMNIELDTILNELHEQSAFMENYIVERKPLDYPSERRSYKPLIVRRREKPLETRYVYNPTLVEDEYHSTFCFAINYCKYRKEISVIPVSYGPIGPWYKNKCGAGRRIHDEILGLIQPFHEKNLDDIIHYVETTEQTILYIHHAEQSSFHPNQQNFIH
jgi:hypothetical protein